MNITLDGNLAVDGQVGSSITLIANVSVFSCEAQLCSTHYKTSFMRIIFNGTV